MTAEGDSRVSWDELRQRLQAAQDALAPQLNRTSERRRAVLKSRAQRIARVPETRRATADLELVEFLVAGERYAVESRHVREVLRLRNLTPVPCTPPFVRGVVNLRGQILPVVDLRRFFDLPDPGITDLNRVIVIRDETRELGLLADRVLGIRALATNLLQPGLPTLTDVRETYLRGVTADRLIVLNPTRLLTEKSLTVHEEVS